MSSSIYKANLLEHYHHSPWKGELKSADKTITVDNPLCGDDLTLYLNFDQNEKVSQVNFTGQGCVISQAATSILLDTLMGKTKTELSQISKQDILTLLQVPISSTREKCALLVLKAINQI